MNTAKFLFCDQAELTSKIYCNSQREALMDGVLSCDESYWLDRIFHNFLISGFGI